jgi:TolA-binding protein
VAAAGLKGLSFVKAAVVGIAAVAMVGGASVAYLDRSAATAPAPPSSGVLGTRVLEPSATALVPLAPSTPVAPASAPTLEKPKSPAASSQPKEEDDPAAEMALLHAAQDALRTSPSSALAKTAEHARRFPRSALAQEREVIAVEALVKLGRKDEARARVARFEKSYPGSTHARRLDALVE